jgi:hypothetical protein
MTTDTDCDKSFKWIVEQAREMYGEQYPDADLAVVTTPEVTAESEWTK